VQADGAAVFHDYAYKSLVLSNLCDLLNREMFFKDFCVPSDCQYSVISSEPVDNGAENQCKEDYGSQNKNHHKNPEDSSFRTVHEKLEAHSEEQQSSQEAEEIFLSLVANHQLIHQGLVYCIAKVIKIRGELLTGARIE
jgi:hypothetical protein